MTLESYLAFTAAAAALAFVPGPTVTVIIANSLRYGHRAGLMNVAGTQAGFVVWLAIAALGLGAAIKVMREWFDVLRWAGALYLVWLAIGAIRHGSALTTTASAPTQAPWHSHFLTGLGINLTNPKVVMFFVTFLPQFIDAGDPHATGKLLFLGFWFLVIGVPTASVIILTAKRFSAAMKRSPRFMRAFDYGFAALMTAFAARLVLAR